MSLGSRLERHAPLVFAGFLLGLLGGAELFVRGAVDVRNVGPSFSEFHPRFLRALKPDVSLHRETPEFRMRLTTNSLGMRGAEPPPELEPWRDVLFLGDSFTMGYGVTDGLEFPALVSERLRGRFGSSRPVRVWNAGVGNAGTARVLRYLEENPEGLAPDLTVVQLCSNDFEDNLAEGLYRLDAAGSLVSLPAPQEPGLLRRVQGFVDRIPLLAHSHLFCLVREAITAGRLPWQREAAPEARGGAAGDELTYALVTRLLLRLRALGSDVIVVSFDVEGLRRRRLEATLDGLGVPHLRLASKAERPDLYFPIDGHWNAGGHRHAADALEPLVASALLAAEGEG